MSSLARENNFDFLRLLFAFLVVYSHSFHLLGLKDPFRVLTEEQIALGPFSVKCFFSISGYLIFQSLERSYSFYNYLWKRVLRIFPGLFIMLLLTIILVIPLGYNNSIIGLLSEYDFYKYLPNNLLLYTLQYEVNGVFLDNKYQTINGSLWSIPYEFTFYLILLILLRLNRVDKLYILVIALLLSTIFALFKPSLLHSLFTTINLSSYKFYDNISFFFSGALLNYIKIKNISYKKRVYGLVLIMGLFVISIHLNVYSYMKYIIVSPMVILLGCTPVSYIKSIGKKLGDVSYGVYIYGFPFQQLLVYYFDMSIQEHIIYSLILSFSLGWLSWHFVEKKALEYKNLIK
ncbi:acyltransferase [Riemerella anatipestifer]|uniref:acyltransferase family protein n=1 Tax=Riemerella anatipestifer TaxID=34085 RepID=UPI001AD76FE0|nr:acyltransferase [Riemerella anatipestifer]MBO4233687.1 acyltransferase [Riemerella anatipestifer]